MANFKSKKNLLQQRGEYARYFDQLRGVDFSSDHNDVEDSRFAYLVNMYRDYQSGQGGAVETIPGFRNEVGYNKNINGIHVGYNKIFIHVGTGIYLAGEIAEDGSTKIYPDRIMLPILSEYDEKTSLCDERTTSFFYNDFLYIIGGGNYVRVGLEGEQWKARTVKSLAYIPTRYRAVDPAALNDTIAEDYGKGKEVEPRNLLSPLYKTTFIADGGTNVFYTKEPIDYGWTYVNNRHVGVFSPEFDVYQYGVRLPLAYNDGNGVPRVPAGYPNAIQEVFEEDSSNGCGGIQLVNDVPAPEKNTWNPSKGAFDYTKDEINSGKPQEDDYEWPYAYTTKYAGVEVTVNRNITAVGGIANDYSMQHTIITYCNIAAVYDNHLFLAGNPNFPNYVFYNHIPDDKSGKASAVYFGENDFIVEGASSSKVVGMMNVGDSLMVMKEDSDEEDSILLHTPQLKSDNVNPVIYPAQRGHKGLGCLGPCINFRDDPIFISKNGVDALGHVSTKYRRAIKHRSSLIDAKLLNCDLKNASVAEWNGYMMILIAGKIFMADSRQMYNTASGNTEYEWYYLEDIGVYNGQFPEYVYAEFPVDLTEEQRLERTGGIEIIEAKRVTNEFGITESLIGNLSNYSKDDIKSVETEYGITYYRELPEYDEKTLDPTGRMIKYYVEPSGGATGGTFDPAVLIKAIGNDLFFATSGGYLCKFNFDKRDPETGLIPNEYYKFCGRTIFSGCATKMDNCGIPHLTKTTVKRSTVIKTRTFEASGIKVKVRTNRKAFNQVARIVNSQATFDDPSFDEYSFTTDGKSIFSINEREKKWVEKQIFVYSDEFCRPFAIHYMAYRYVIAGRYKE